MTAGRYLPVSALLLALCLAACRADVPSAGSQQLGASEGSGALSQSEIIVGAEQTVEHAIGAKMELGRDVVGAILHKGVTSTTPLQNSSPPTTPPSTTAASTPTTTTATQPPSSTPTNLESTTLPQNTAVPTSTPLPTRTAQLTTSPQGTTPPPTTPPSTTTPPGPNQCVGSNGMYITIDNSTCAPVASGSMSCPSSTTFCSTTYTTGDITPGKNVTVARINSQCNGMGACSTSNGTEAIVCNTGVDRENCTDTSNSMFTVSCGTSASGLGQILYQDSTGVGNCASDVDCITTLGAGPEYACIAVNITANLTQCLLPGPISQDCQTLATTCFPPDALVRVKGGHLKTMEQVRIGDLLQSISQDGLSTYEEVYMIAHDDPYTTAAFVTVHHSDSGKDGGNTGVIKLTPDHYLAVGRSWAEHSMQPARTLQPGMHIFIASSEDCAVASHVITKVEHTLQRGVFAPFTMNGVLVVDNVVSSAFTEIGAAKTLRMLNIDPAAAQQVALAPVRFLYRMSGASLAIRCDSAQCSNHRVAAVLIMFVIMLGSSLAIAHAVAWWAVKEANLNVKMSKGTGKHNSAMSVLKA